MADPDYSLLTPQQVVRERKRITDMMANGSGADLGTVARMDALLAQQEKKYAENQALLERANADSLGDKPAEYKPGVSPKAKKASSAASGAPRKEPEVIDTDELHRRANARSEEGNAVTGVAPKPAAAEEEPRGMGGSAVSLSDWTGDATHLNKGKDYGYGERQDGTNKGRGYLGEVQGKSGKMTEYSVGVNIGGRDMDVPSMVPGLTPAELKAIKGEKMPASVVEKARAHATSRMDKALPVFADEYDQPGAPARDAALNKELAGYGSPDYGDKLVYGGASGDDMVRAGVAPSQLTPSDGLKSAPDATQTWVKMYDENTRDPYNWDKRGR